jgi:hypothetical protein
MSAVALNAGWKRHRLLVWSGDRKSGSTTDYRVDLAFPFSSVVYVDLASSSVTGFLLKIDELPSCGKTTSGVDYWRFPTDLTSTRASPLPDGELRPQTLSRLSIKWRQADGTPITTTVEDHTIELDVWETN